jgi:dephospho-CoA kinase
MVRVALTGGIATGKSHVLAQLRQAGVPVIDADVLAREAVAKGAEGLGAVVARFGRDVLRADGTLDRAKLGGIVFGDAAARRDLERIVHPIVRRSIDAFFAALPAATPFAVADVPLLYETGQDAAYDRVIVVACDAARQIERVMTRDHLSREDAERRVAAQLPIATKVARADHVIRTDGTHADTSAQVDALLGALPAGRSGRPAP